VRERTIRPLPGNTYAVWTYRRDLHGPGGVNDWANGWSYQLDLSTELACWRFVVRLHRHGLRSFGPDDPWGLDTVDGQVARESARTRRVVRSHLEGDGVDVVRPISGFAVLVVIRHLHHDFSVGTASTNCGKRWTLKVPKCA
jgi:hypothetical protein